MGAVPGNKNAVGNKGGGAPSLNDRRLSAKVRTKVLEDIYLVLTEAPEVLTWPQMKKDIVMKMSSGVLPRLNEHTGEDGGDLKIVFDNAFGKADTEDKPAEEAPENLEQVIKKPKKDVTTSKAKGNRRKSGKVQSDSSRTKGRKNELRSGVDQLQGDSSSQEAETDEDLFSDRP